MKTRTYTKETIEFYGSEQLYVVKNNENGCAVFNSLTKETALNYERVMNQWLGSSVFKAMTHKEFYN